MSYLRNTVKTIPNRVAMKALKTAIFKPINILTVVSSLSILTSNILILLAKASIFLSCSKTNLLDSATSAEALLAKSSFTPASFKALYKFTDTTVITNTYLRNKDKTNPAKTATLRLIKRLNLVLNSSFKDLIATSTLEVKVSILLAKASIFLSCSKTNLLDSATSAEALLAKSSFTPASFKALYKFTDTTVITNTYLLRKLLTFIRYVIKPKKANIMLNKSIICQELHEY